MSYQNRAYTLLLSSHEEAIRVGRFLDRSADAEKRFPTFAAALHTASRTRPDAPAPPPSPSA